MKPLIETSLNSTKKNSKINNSENEYIIIIENRKRFWLSAK